MKPGSEPLFSAETIQSRVRELASEIDAVLGDIRPILLTVLDGGLPFSKALRSELKSPFDTGTLRAKSYRGITSTGSVEVTINSNLVFEGRVLILIEDIVDTGITAATLVEVLRRQKPRAIRMAALLDKPSRRVVPYTPAWTGFTIEDRFVIGFGLDYDGAYRDLPDIRILEP